MVQYARESIRELHPSGDPELAPDGVTELGSDLKEADHPFAAVAFGRPLACGKGEIATWQLAGMRDGPTEAVDNGAKRVERWAIGLASFRSCTIELLLYASEPNNDLPTFRPSDLPTFRPSDLPSVGPRADARTGTRARALVPAPMHEGSGVRPRWS